MPYELTRDQLINSAYYCGAGFDLQPILRFGDMIENFVYVSVGFQRDEFINGIKEFISNIKCLNLELNLESYKDIDITDIEHPIGNRLIVGIPDYFEDHDYLYYSKTFLQFYNAEHDFHLKMCFTLRINEIEKTIKLFHISGEALATYDAIFRRQGIAPKVFISIQTGMLEISDGITNDLFRLSDAKPKIWVRGVWERNENWDYHYPDVFNERGLYNEKIGEFKNWKVTVDQDIQGVTNSQKLFRIVKAYGQDFEWQHITNDTLEYHNVVINKKLEKYNGNMANNYNLLKLHFPLSNIHEIPNEEDQVFQQNPHLTEIKIAILPFGYECFELMLNEFFENYMPNNFYNLSIDIFYANKSDLDRNW